MAGKGDVSIRLTLDGAAEVKAALNTMAKAGDAFFKGFKQGADQAVPGFAAKMDGALQKVQAGFRAATAAKDRFASGFARVATDLTRVGNAATGVARRVALIQGAAVGAVGALALIAKGALEAGDEAVRMAERVGMGVESFTALAGVAKTFDVEQDALVASMTRLNVQIEKGAEKAKGLKGHVKGIGDAADDLTDSLGDLDQVEGNVFNSLQDNANDYEEKVIKVYRATKQVTTEIKKVNDESKKGAKTTIFKKLGLDVLELQKLTPEERLYKIADALKSIEDPTRRSALAVELLGKGGGRMLNILSGGSGDLRKAMEEMKRYGIVLSDTDKKVIELADDQQDKLGLAIAGLRMQVGLRLVPALGRASDIITDLILKNRAWFEGIAETVGQYAELAAIDLGKLLSGDTAGISETNKWMITVRDTLLNLKTTAIDVFDNQILPAFTKIREYAQDAADVLNEWFGTDFSGDGLLVATAIGYITGALTLFVSIGNLAVGVMNLLMVPLRLLGQAVIALGVSLAGLLGLPAIVGVAIVGAIIAAIGLIYYYWDQIGPYFEEIWAGVVAITKVQWEIMKTIISGFWTAFKAFALPVITWLTGVAWEAVKRTGMLVWTLIKAEAVLALKIISGAVKLAATIITGAWDLIKAGASALWDALPKDWETARTAIVDGFKALPGYAAEAWEGIKSAATKAWDFIADSALKLANKIAPAFEAVKTTVTGIWDGIGTLASQAWDGVVSIVTTAAENVATAVGSVARKAYEAWTGASQSVAESAKQITDAISKATDLAGDVEGAQALAAKLVEPFNAAKEKIDSVMAGIAAAVGAAFTGLSGIIGAAFEGVINAIAGSAGTLQGAWQSVLNGISNSFTSMVNAVTAQIERLKSVLASLRSAIAAASAAAASGGQKKAGGGLIYGVGGPTQDNIPIWASAGEFMLRAAAVKRLPLAFLKALNSGRYDLGDLLHRFSNMRFASGGLISGPSSFAMPALALAGGGSAPSSSLTLVLGGEMFPGLSGPADTISRLERAVKMKKIKATGRPSPYATR